MQWTEQEKDYHDEISENYIEQQKKSGWRFLEKYFLFNKLPYKENLKILDIGCGPAIGMWENFKNKKHLDIYYVGIDISKELLKYAKNNYPGNYILADLNRIPLSEEAEFDVIVLLGVLHHLENWESVLINVSKYSKNRGLILLREPNENAFVTWKGDSPNEHPINEKEIIELMDDRFKLVQFHSLNSLFGKYYLERKFPINKMLSLPRGLGYLIKARVEILMEKIFKNSQFFKLRDNFYVFRRIL